MDELYLIAESLIIEILEEARLIVPIDTGNLRLISIRLERAGKGKWEIYVDLNIAPYAPTTNEPWTAQRWHGKKNPNEGWWQRFSEFVIRQVQERLLLYLRNNYGKFL